VDFGANWCPPCRVISPILKSLAEASADRLKVAEINVEEAEELAARFGITHVPVQLLFRDGRLLDRRVGAASRSTLERWVASALT
jgi:thioredoxin 1